MSRLLALPPELLEAVVALVPEEGDGQEEDEYSYSCAGVGFRLATSGRPDVEATCRGLRRTALALPPARLWLQFDHTQPDGGIDVRALLRGLRRRPPAAKLEVQDLPAGIEPAVWEQLAAPLLGSARQLRVRGGVADPLLVGARRFGRLSSLKLWPTDYGGDTPLPTSATLASLSTLNNVDLDYEGIPAHLLDALASLPLLKSVGVWASHLPADDSDVWPQLAALGSKVTSLHLQLGDFDDFQPAVLPPGLLALRAASGIQLDVYPGGQEAALPGLDGLPGVEDIHVWDSFDALEIWRCRNLRSLTFSNAVVALPPGAQPAAYLTRLTSLSLSHTSFLDGHLPRALCDLPQLRLLSVRHSIIGSLTLPKQASRLTAVEQLSLGRLLLDEGSCAALASMPALTQLRVHECTLHALPAGPYQSTLRDLSLLKSSRVADEELPPPSIAGASQLTALRCSLHMLRPATLHERWPAFESTLRSLPNLQHVCACAAPNRNAHAAAVLALLQQLFAASGLSCSLECSDQF